MKTTKFFIILALSSTLAGCSDWLSEDGAPKLTYEYYETKEGISAAVISAYSSLRWGCGGERFDVLTEMGTDLFRAGSGGNYRASFNMYGTQLNPDVNILNQMWENHYKGIGTANLAMDGILNSNLSENEKKQNYAEMQFIRSYLYFDLVQQFGRIPLVTEGSLEVRTSFQRASVEDVYKQIITDLRACVENLSPTTSEKGRATNYAASHLLSKVYLTRGSAVTDKRGQKPTDMDSVLYYSEKVINEGIDYKLVQNYADLWDIDNMGNSEVIFAVQFTNNSIFNDNGNTFHLYWGAVYDDELGMKRNIFYGRPYNRYKPTDKVLFQLFDRKNDSRFYKSFRWVYYSNNEKTIPTWQSLEENGTTYFVPDASAGQIEGKPKYMIGDTAIYYTVERLGFGPQSIEMKKVRAERKYIYYPYEMQDVKRCPSLLKHMAPNRPSVAERASSREWVRMRLGETYLIAAEAAGRKGDYALAAKYINIVRERAAWHDGEAKAPQYYTIEGGNNDTKSTFDEIKVTEAELGGTDFVEFMLDERARELLGEIVRWEDLVRTEKFYDWVKLYNPDATGLKEYHRLRPIPQTHIDRLKPAGEISEEQNEGYY